MDKNGALLVVSYGTSYEETRKRTLEAIEKDLVDAFSERKFYRAWTSKRIVKKLRETRHIFYDNVQEAMERMLCDGITDVVVQPTHMMRGVEFLETENTIRSYCGKFETLRMGMPMLSEKENVRELAMALEEIFSDIKASEMLAFMGHGSAQYEFPVYELLEEQFRKDGFSNFCVGTVEYEPGFAPVLSRVREKKPDRVYVSPLLVAAGNHALKDMAGDSPDSWKSRLEGEGVETVCIVRGLGEYQKIRDIYVNHARSAIYFNGKEEN